MKTMDSAASSAVKRSRRLENGSLVGLPGAQRVDHRTFLLNPEWYASPWRSGQEQRPQTLAYF